MIDKIKLHDELVAVEAKYGSVMKAPNTAMAGIWSITHRVGKPVRVSERDYDIIAKYAESNDEPEYLVAKKLKHAPTWLDYRAQAYKENRLFPVRWETK